MAILFCMPLQRTTKRCTFYCATLANSTPKMIHNCIVVCIIIIEYAKDGPPVRRKTFSISSLPLSTCTPPSILRILLNFSWIPLPHAPPVKAILSFYFSLNLLRIELDAVMFAKIDSAHFWWRIYNKGVITLESVEWGAQTHWIKFGMKHLGIWKTIPFICT